jgi:hypothetical protein
MYFRIFLVFQEKTKNSRCFPNAIRRIAALRKVLGEY